MPERPGDFCRFGNVVGTVEEIGLRSTTIRTLNRTLVVIPNSVFSAIEIENFSERDRIRFYQELRLNIAEPGQLTECLEALRKLFLASADVVDDTVSVRFFRIDDAAAILRRYHRNNTRCNRPAHAENGLISSIWHSSKSLIFLVATAKPRDRAMDAICPSRLLMGRPISLRWPRTAP